MENRVGTQWKDGVIEDCRVESLNKYRDKRGWLAEFFRIDEIDPLIRPEMGYVSVTSPGIERGPHEHAEQTDLFVFFHGRFKLYLWDVRPDSPSSGVRQVLTVGAANPSVVVVPPGIVHAYRNEGSEPGFVVNCPNRLYGGWEEARSGR